MEAERELRPRLGHDDRKLLVRAPWLAIAGLGGYLCLIPFFTTPDLATLLLISFALLARYLQSDFCLNLHRVDYVVVAVVVLVTSCSALLSSAPVRGLEYLVYLLINMILMLMAAGLREKSHVKTVALLIGLLGVAHLSALIIASQAAGIAGPNSIVDHLELTTLIVPNDALILGLCLPALAWALLDGNRHWTVPACVFLAIYLALSIFVCHLLQSKVALLSLMIAAGSAVLFRYKIKKRAADWASSFRVFGTLLGLILLAGGLSWYLGNQSTTRFSLWAEALMAHSSLKEFVIGAGPNTFLFNPSAVASAFDKGDLIIPWVHNLYLEAWYDQGSFGLLALLALTLLPVFRALRIEDRNLRTMILASMVTFIVASVFEVTLTRRFYFAFLAIFYGLAAGQTMESSNEQSS